MRRDVLVIAHQYLPSDPRVGKSIEALNEAGASVDVLCLREPGQSFRASLGSARLYRLPVRRHRGAGLPVYLAEYAAFFALALLTAAALAVRRRYRVVVTHTLPDPLIFAAAVPRLLGARVVMDMHEFTPELYETRYDLERSHPLIRAMLLLERWSCRFAHTVVTVHDPGVEILRRTGLPPERFVVVMNSADIAAAERPAVRRPDRPFTLVYHGTLVNQYDLVVVLEAMARMELRGDDGFVLRIIGGGPGLEGLRVRAAKLGIEDRVHFEPAVSLARIPAILAECDAGVATMHDVRYAHVALPMKVLECMAAHLPVISNPTRVLGYYFDERSLCRVPFGDAAALAEAMRRVRDDDAYRRDLVENAIESVRPIRWEVMARRFTEACGITPPEQPYPAEGRARRGRAE